MSSVKFGCQTYSWQMSYEKYQGEIPHIAGIMHQAGFSGIEAEVVMLGEKYFPDPAALREVIAGQQLQFAALALPLRWEHPKETEQEFELAQKAIDFVGSFPGAKLILCHLPGKDRNNLQERQRNQIACITEIGKRAADRGITAAFHPNSSYGSAFRTREDYELLLEGIANETLGYAPDAGHIAHGGMDPLDIMKTYHEKIRHIHFKDMAQNGDWKSMGSGVLDFGTITGYMDSIGYDGWIMVEEESADAARDPDSVTLGNGRYVQNNLK